MESVSRHLDYSSKGNAWDKRLVWIGSGWLVMRNYYYRILRRPAIEYNTSGANISPLYAM